MRGTHIAQNGGDAPAEEEEGRHTHSPFDELQALIVAQGRTISSLQRRIFELEMQIVDAISREALLAETVGGEPA